MLDFNIILWYYFDVMTAVMCEVADTPGVVVSVIGFLYGASLY